MKSPDCPKPQLPSESKESPPTWWEQLFCELQEVYEVSQNLGLWEDIVGTGMVVGIKIHSPEAKGLPNLVGCLWSSNL